MLPCTGLLSEASYSCSHALHCCWHWVAFTTASLQCLVFHNFFCWIPWHWLDFKQSSCSSLVLHLLHCQVLLPELHCTGMNLSEALHRTSIEQVLHCIALHIVQDSCCWRWVAFPKYCIPQVLHCIAHVRLCGTPVRSILQLQSCSALLLALSCIPHSCIALLFIFFAEFHDTGWIVFYISISLSLICIHCIFYFVLHYTAFKSILHHLACISESYTAYRC